ncbi:MAG: hypothetical protein RTU09_06220 [Candidatus Thorarchaeota archaeon]
MRARAFPETRKEPRKRILLIPVLLVFGGLLLTTIEILRFIGSVLALTGVLTLFMVGMVYADLLAASKRTKDLIEARKARNIGASEEPIDEDPFVDTLHDEDNM